jgi:hypothetical protein
LRSKDATNLGVVSGGLTARMWIIPPGSRSRRELRRPAQSCRSAYSAGA